MKIKGIVEQNNGNKLVINLNPTARVINLETGEKKYSTAWKNHGVPRVGSIVRILFRPKDKK